MRPLLFALDGAHISPFGEEFGVYDQHITIQGVDEGGMMEQWSKILGKPGRYSLIEYDYRGLTVKWNHGKMELLSLKTLLGFSG